MKPVAILCFIPLWLLAGCSSTPTAPTTATTTAAGALASTRPLPVPFIDAALKTAIEDHGGELSTQGGLRNQDVAPQLERTACAASPVPANTTQLELPELYERTVPGVLVLARIFHCDNCNRWHTRSAATAFALSADGICVTNYHVFEHGDDDSTLVVGDAWGTTHLVLEVLAANKRDDIAIFRVSVESTPLTPLPLRTGAPVGTTVAVISHPANHYFSLAQGIISRRVWRLHGMNNDMNDHADDAHADDPQSPAPRTQTIEVTADYGVGSSGGPVLDMCGNVVGMVSNTSPVYADSKDKRSLQMNFHHCVPVESILDLIKAE